MDFSHRTGVGTGLFKENYGKEAQVIANVFLSIRARLLKLGVSNKAQREEGYFFLQGQHPMKQTTLNFHLKAKKDILWLECQIHKGIREKTELQRNFLLVIARYTPLYYISTFTLLFPSCSLQLWAFHQRIYFIVISTKISGSSQLSVLVENFERRW